MKRRDSVVKDSDTNSFTKSTSRFNSKSYDIFVAFTFIVLRLLVPLGCLIIGLPCVYCNGETIHDSLHVVIGVSLFIPHLVFDAHFMLEPTE